MLPRLASLLKDVALVGSQTHGAKNEGEPPPHWTCLPPQSPLASQAEGCVGGLLPGAVLGPEPEPLT